MKRTIVVLIAAVLAFSLAAVAADNTRVTTQARPGGTPYKAVGRMTAPIFTNLATKDPKGVYFCCDGGYLFGPNNSLGFPAYSDAIQFSLTAATTIHKITTSVNYLVAGTYTDFLFAIEADSSGVPSGTPLGKGPWAATIDSQSFGQCCAVEVGKVKPALNLPAGTYWMVWTTESGSDLSAEINFEVLDGVDFVNVAVSDANGAAGSWTASPSNAGFNVQIQ